MCKSVQEKLGVLGTHVHSWLALACGTNETEVCKKDVYAGS
jgi:hypothetical protein